MANLRDTHRSAEQRTLPFRTRGDLQVVRTAVSGQGLYVVRDPVTQNVFQLTPQEYDLLDRLRAPATLHSLQQFFQRQFAPLRATTRQIHQFIQRLYEQGLLLSDQLGQGESLHRRGRRRTWTSRLMGALQVLSVRVGGVAPGRLAEGLARWFGWLFSPVGFLIVSGLGLLAVGVLIANGLALMTELPRLSAMFSAGTLPIWIGSIAAVKMLHELGHATACQRFGGRCEEIGMLLLAGLPTLYCDVSDAWRIPDKWRRMAVSAAGMYVELIVAASAVLVWRFTHPGVIHSICVSLIVVCSVGTLLVNANPLLRYDGYYLLSDWLETPNLAERAKGLWTAGWRSWLLGDRVPADPLLGPYKRAALRSYAVATKVYLAFVLAAIFAMMIKLARPFHLENAVYTLGVVALMGLLLQPTVATARLLRNPLTRSRIRKLRLLFAGVAIVGGAAMILALPVTRHVRATVVLLPAQSHSLFTTTSGTLDFAATPGAWVKHGDVVVQLRNEESELRILQQEGQVQQRETRLEQLLTLRVIDPSANEQIAAARADLADAKTQLEELREAAEALTLRAPAAGTVLPPPPITSGAADDDVLPKWRGSPLDGDNVGAWIESNVALAAVAADDRRVAWAAVDQADIGFVEPGQTVRLVTQQEPMHILTGHVSRVTRTARENRPNDSDGDSASDAMTEDYHVVEIAVDDADAALAIVVGARGQAKIETHRTTVWDLLATQLRRIVRSSLSN